MDSGLPSWHPARIAQRTFSRPKKAPDKPGLLTTCSETAISYQRGSLRTARLPLGKPRDQQRLQY
jgi:hypothetical protein